MPACQEFITRQDSLVVMMTKGEYFVEETSDRFGNLQSLIDMLVEHGIKSVVIRLETGLYFTQDLLRKKLPPSRAHALAKLDLAEKFPFLARDTRLFFYITSEGSKYAAVKSSVIEPTISALSDDGVSTECIQIATSSGIFELYSSDFRLGAYQPKNVLKLTTLFVTAALLLVSIGTLGHIFIRNSYAISKLEDEIQIKQRTAAEIVKQQKVHTEQIRMQQAARASKISVRPVWMLWDEVTRLLPDNTWLTDMSVSKGDVSLVGYSAAAAELIPLLGASNVVTNAAFSSQVTRVPGQDGERFSIRMRVRSRD